MGGSRIGHSRYFRRLLSSNSNGKSPKTVGENVSPNKPGPKTVGENALPNKPGQEPLKTFATPPGTSKKTPTFTGQKPLQPSPPGQKPLQPSPPGQDQNKRWLFSESFPVDVRILAGGTVAFAGLLTYAYNKRVEEGQSRLQATTETEADPARTLESHDRPSEIDLPSRDQSSFYTDEIAADSPQSVEEQSSSLPSLSDDSSHGSAEAGAHSDNLKEEDSDLLLQADLEALSNAQSTDDPKAREIADILGSVFTSAVPQVQPDDEQIKEAQAASEHDGHQSYTQAAAANDSKVEPISQHGSPASSDSGIPAIYGHPAVAAATAALQGNGSKEEVEGAVREPETSVPDSTVTGPSDTAATSDKTAETSTSYSQLGIADDLRPAALVRKAVERGEGSGDNWQEYHSRLLQAQADARTFQETLNLVLQNQQGKEAAAQTHIAELESRIHSLQKEKRDNALFYKQAIEEQEQLAEMIKNQELRRIEDYLATAYAEAAIKERAIRASQLDQIRSQLNGLSQAFGRRSSESRTSHTVHKLSVGTVALLGALQQGAPFAAEAASLRASCSDDPLITAVLDSLPTRLADQGVATQVQLLDSWPSTRRSISKLAMLSPGKTTFLGLGLASLASSLKVKEAPGLEGVEQTLALAESKLLAGKGLEAAQLIHQAAQGTAAEIVERDFSEKLQARAIVEQALKVLEAHASSSAASLS